jgi:uncharacterized membrane protein YgcG
MNHKWNKFDRCEYCGIIKSSANALQACVSKDEYDDGFIDPLISTETMATFASLFESSDTSSSGSDDFSGGGGDFGGGGSSSDY